MSTMTKNIRVLRDVSGRVVTLREADKIAKNLGLNRGAGTYNGAPYWTNSLGEIVTRDRLAEMAGLV